MKLPKNNDNKSENNRDLPNTSDSKANVKQRMPKNKKNLTNNNHKTTNALIAYFDILGYKQLIDSGFISENILIGRIERITADIYKTKRMPHAKDLKWNIYSFSDNYAIVVDYPEIGFMYTLSFLIWILEIVQCQFFALYGILIRGAITRGNIYVGKNFIYGKGLIDAYEIENSVAIYPRIVVDSNLIEECMKIVSDLFPEPIIFKGVVYDPKEITTENLFKLFPLLIFGTIYDSGEIEKREIDIRIEREKNEDLIVVCKDFDSQYYLDFLQYLLFIDRYPNDFDDELMTEEIEQENMVDLFVFGFTLHITNYIKTFGENHKLLKKYLWVCVKANNKFNCLGYNNLFNRATILELCNIDLNSIHTEDETLRMLISLLPNNEQHE